MYEVVHGVTCISCYESQEKKLEIIALEVNSIAFQILLAFTAVE